MKLFGIMLLVFVLSSNISHAQEEENKKSSSTLEFGVTSMLVDLAFPGFDFDFICPFYKKGVNSLALKNTLFLYIRGNAFYPPIFIQLGPLFELQYRVSAKNGFLFTIETGLGFISEMFTNKIYSEEKGFHTHPGLIYGLFSVSTHLGYDFMPKYHSPWKCAFMLGYRIQFPFNLFYNDYILLGLSLGYAFDIKGKGKGK